MKKYRPSIKKGDILIIYGYESILHYDKFKYDVEPKEMRLRRTIEFTKRDWCICPSDCTHVPIDAGVTHIGDGLPRSYEKEILKRGHYWLIELEVKRPKR